MQKQNKKRKLSFKKTVSNNLFALKAIWSGSKVYLLVNLGISAASAVLGFLSETYLLRVIVNGVQSGKSIDDIIKYIVILGIITVVFYTSTNAFGHILSRKMQRRIAANIEKQLFRQSARVELACYETPEFYDKYVRAMDEAYNRMMGVMWALGALISKFVALSADSLLLFVIDPWLILFGLFPLLLGFIKKVENRLSHKHQVELKTVKRKANYVKRTFYLSDYAKEVRIGNMHLQLLEDFRNTFNEYKALMKKYSFKRASLVFLQHIGLEVVTILGATLYSVWSVMCVGPENGGMMVGDCLVVLSSIGVISRNLNNLVQNFAQFDEHALFLEDVRFFLDYTPKILDGDKTAPKEGGDLVVKDLSFRYEGAESDTLKDINFTLHKGERIALVGSNGSGKTTLVKLLMRLYDPREGEITLNGDNIKDFTVDSYRHSFGTVFQDFKVFSLNVCENVIMRPEGEGDRELVESALKESGIYEKIAGLDKGLDSILTREFDDNGVNLSIGEQQKLSLARVFADYTPFVILDEPSSALDPIAEYKMFENMIRATKGRSVIFISHRLSSAVLADRVILMDKGQIAEIGTHNELLAQNGKYAEMFRRQAENYLGSEVTENA